MQSRVGSMVCSECGQSTVEYAVIMAAFLTLIIALASLWQVLDRGVFVAHALASASHHLTGVFSGVVVDAFLV